jgi:hypothetical protein
MEPQHRTASGFSVAKQTQKKTQKGSGFKFFSPSPGVAPGFATVAEKVKA